MKPTFALLLVILFANCTTTSKTSKTTPAENAITGFTDGPPAFVYKTKADYQKLVPVLLSDDKTTIVSYPHPDDLKNAGGYLMPTPLQNGYWLDNRGINKNVAFLKLTYEQYAALEAVPSLSELYSMIVDKEPLSELYNCGNRNAFSNAEAELNQIISNGSLKKKCRPER
jgi:hypothetical protein